MKIGLNKTGFALLDNGLRCFTTTSCTFKNSWLQRQSKDRYTRQAKVEDLRSRAAFKLMEIDKRYKIFKSGQTVVDLVRVAFNLNNGWLYH